MSCCPLARLAVVVPAVVAGLAVASCTPPARVPGAAADDLRFPLPDFRLTERSGKAVAKADLAGKVWVASFVFTRCSGPCPAVTATVARLQAELAGEPNVRFVTFTVDPDRDDPGELKKYADRYRADPEKWLFLTGQEAEIHALMTDGFKLGVARRPDPKPGDEFDHSTRLAVVDKAGTVRGYFDGMPANWDEGGSLFEDGLKQLKAKVAELARE
jgi:cytochrome oxidase Cu insertion factor (SCO1/SenC/PrrC family)